MNSGKLKEDLELKQLEINYDYNKAYANHLIATLGVLLVAVIVATMKVMDDGTIALGSGGIFGLIYIIYILIHPLKRFEDAKDRLIEKLDGMKRIKTDKKKRIIKRKRQKNI